MTLADEIRTYTYEHFVAPQLQAKGFAVVRASDVHNAMGFQDRYPAICSVLGGKIFRSTYALALVDRQGKKVSSATEYTYETAHAATDKLSASTHLDALRWFERNAGETVSWQDLSDREPKLAIMPKGIYRPAGWRHVLSIKIIPAGRYPDEEPALHNGRPRFRYHQEEPKGADPKTYFTNVGLRNALLDRVPVGVVRQTKPKPAPLYEVLGLGQVIDWQGQFFTIELEAPHDAIEDREPGRANEADWAPVSMADARDRMLRNIVRRRGQAAFRARLLDAYQSQCAISDCDIPDVLEAAHIKPYLGDHTNVVSNGLLLRADLHTLFDLRLLRINPETHRVVVAPALRASEYGRFHGRPLKLPSHEACQPALDCLQFAWSDSPPTSQPGAEQADE
jgi:hypothetical protein